MSVFDQTTQLYDVPPTPGAGLHTTAPGLRLRSARRDEWAGAPFRTPDPAFCADPNPNPEPFDAVCLVQHLPHLELVQWLVKEQVAWCLYLCVAPVTARPCPAVQGTRGHLADKRGWTPLHFAASAGNLEICQWLLECNGANPLRRENEYGRVAAHLAADGGHTSVMVLLLKAGKAGPEIADDYGTTCLHLSASRGFRHTVKWLVFDAKVPLSVRGAKGQSPLHQACIFELLDTAVLLLSMKADTNPKEDNGCTPLHWACANGDDAMVKLLLEHGADYTEENYRGRTPLDWAIDHGRDELVK